MNSTYEIAERISEAVGVPQQPFNSVYEICIAIYHEIGGTQTRFDSVYEVCEAIYEQIEAHPVVELALLNEIYYQLTGEYSTETDGVVLTQEIIGLIQDLQAVATNAEIDQIFDGQPEQQPVA